MTEYMLLIVKKGVILLLLAGSLAGCDTILGTKGDETTGEIFEEGKIDPQLVPDEIGYAAMLPFWESFDAPTDVYVGYDELIYVTDRTGLHLLDRAGRAEYDPVELDGAVAVTQDRNLNVYVAARYDTVITAVDSNLVWNLPAVYKFRDINKGNPVPVDTIIHPFDDSSQPTTSAQRARLNKDNPNNDELVAFTDVTALGDNTIYITRRGPLNVSGQAVAPDNIVMEFQEDPDRGGGKMLNNRLIRALSPNTPSLISAVGPSAITGFAGPPQRQSITDDRSFLIAQAGTNPRIPFRVLWINAEETPDGLQFGPRTELLARDTTEADRFLYDQFRFTEPSGIAWSADGRNHIFITDAATDSLYLFQSRGVEGVNPPPGAESTRPEIVSFGGTGSGSRQFRSPGGVAYFREVVYVADTGNNRITRHKLNTDFERF